MTGGDHRHQIDQRVGDPGGHAAADAEQQGPALGENGPPAPCRRRPGRPPPPRRAQAPPPPRCAGHLRAGRPPGRPPARRPRPARRPIRHGAAGAGPAGPPEPARTAGWWPAPDDHQSRPRPGAAACSTKPAMTAAERPARPAGGSAAAAPPGRTRAARAAAGSPLLGHRSDGEADTAARASEQRAAARHRSPRGWPMPSATGRRLGGVATVVTADGARGRETGGVTSFPRHSRLQAASPRIVRGQGLASPSQGTVRRACSGSRRCRPLLAPVRGWRCTTRQAITAAAAAVASAMNGNAPQGAGGRAGTARRTDDQGERPRTGIATGGRAKTSHGGGAT